MSSSAQAAITKYHRLDGLYYIYFSVLEAGKSMIRCWQIQCLERALFLFADGWLLLRASRGAQGEEERPVSFFLLTRA